MKGIDIRTVADLMGHKTLAMTMLYAHLAPEHLAAAVAALDSFWIGTDTKSDTDVADAGVGRVLEIPQAVGA